MKKIRFLLICLTALCTNTVLAQSEWSLGPRIGANFSCRQSTEDSKYCTHTVGGVFGEFKYKKFATELDVLFTKQGSKYPSENDNENKFKCILIPLKFKFYPFRNYGLHVFAGPQLDIYTGESSSLYVDGGTQPKHKKTIMSATFGLGYRFKFGLELTFNYNHGLQKIVNDPKVYIDEITDYYVERDHVFQITAAYDLCKLFKTGKK